MSRSSNANNSDVLIADCMKSCLNKLEELSERLKENVECLPQTDLDAFTEGIDKQTKACLTANHCNVKNKEAILSVLGVRTVDDERTSDELKAAIKERAAETQKGYNVRQEAKYKKISSNLGNETMKAQADDEDFEVLEKGLNDNSIKCPYTATTFVEPMKKYVCPSLSRLFSIYIYIYIYIVVIVVFFVLHNLNAFVCVCVFLCICVFVWVVLAIRNSKAASTTCRAQRWTPSVAIPPLALPSAPWEAARAAGPRPPRSWMRSLPGVSLGMCVEKSSRLSGRRSESSRSCKLCTYRTGWMYAGYCDLFTYGVFFGRELLGTCRCYVSKGKAWRLLRCDVPCQCYQLV
jgi:hypothetical protein